MPAPAERTLNCPCSIEAIVKTPVYARTDGYVSYFFFNDTATTEIYTFPYTTLFRSWWRHGPTGRGGRVGRSPARRRSRLTLAPDRKSTRLNSSHLYISYAGFCLTKRLTPQGSDRASRRGLQPCWRAHSRAPR